MEPGKPTRRRTAAPVVEVRQYRATDGSLHDSHRAAAERNRVLAAVEMMKAATADVEHHGPPTPGSVATLLFTAVAERFYLAPRKVKGEADG